MNYQSHFSLLSLISAFAVACNGATDENIYRSQNASEQRAAYESRSCWVDQRGDLVAFLVIGTSGRTGVPYIISARCFAIDGYSSYGEATIDRLNTIRIVDSYGNLQRLIPGQLISSNVTAEAPIPSSNSKVYFLRGHLVRVRSNYLQIYALRNITLFTDTDTSFLRFLDMTNQQRERFFRSYTGITGLR